MLRRFEIYSLAAATDPSAVEALAAACAHCGSFIPEVLSSKVGRNLSDAPVQMVWEHAFDSPAAYRRYMVHPYHSNVLDRYLLADSPERIVGHDDLGAGLVGYACDGPVFDMAHGVRRLVLLRLDPRTTPDQLRRLGDLLTDAPAEVPSMTLSVVGANTLGAAWFDAETPIGGRPRWTHLWEQGFDSLESLAAYRDGPSSWADVERRGWAGWMDGIVRRAASVYYEIDPLIGFGVVHV